jgi:4-aminobutyrate aminotransferase-like enzyme
MTTADEAPAATTDGATADGAPAATGPSVEGAYPGPRARAVIERMRAVEGAGPRTGGSDDPLVVESALGSILTDPDGNRFVDLAGSFAAATIGHSHPAVVAAVREQVGRVSHVSSAAMSEPRVAFEEALVSVAPAGLDRVLLGMSGADANDTAIRLARTATGRREIIAFSGGFFGRRAGVLGIGGKSRFRSSVGVAPDAHFLPYPYPYRWPLGGGQVPDSPGHVGEQALSLVRHAFEDPASGVGPVAAVVVEPIQGNGGVVIPPDGFLVGLRDLCDRHGAILVFDEIQSGFGRTGRTWAAEHWGVTPDLMTVGKGVGGGLAVSAVVGRSTAMSHWAPGTHTSTFLGDAVNLAAGTAAIGVLRDEGLADRSATLGSHVLARLHDALDGAKGVGEIRGIGLFIALELVTDHDARTPDPDRVARIRRAAFTRGILLGAGGHHENVVKLCPPLTIEQDLLDAALDLTIETIRSTP